MPTFADWFARSPLASALRVFIAVARIEIKQAEIEADVRDVRAKIDDHIAWHLTDKDR